MQTHSRILVVCATAGLLALAGASVLSAQQQPRDTLQTGAVTPNDSMNPPAAKADTALRAKPGLQTGPAMNDTARIKADSERMKTDTAKPPTGRVNTTTNSGFKYHGPPTDTALKARPGTQTGQVQGDTTKTAKKKHRWHKKTTSDSTKSQSDTTRSH